MSNVYRHPAADRSGDSASGGDGAPRIDLAHERDFTLGSLNVQPALRQVSGPEGEATVEPKVMQVLVALASPAGTILSRDDLIERCWDGRIVGDASINRVISLLRGALRDTGGEGVSVDTLPKVGYRLLVEGEAEDAPEAARSKEANAPAADEETAKRPATLLYAALFAGFLAVLAAVLAFGGWFAPTAKNRIAIAMLPIELSDPDDPFVAQGFEAELRTQLARNSAISVTASDTARQLAGDNLDPQKFGSVLEADYVWQGELVEDEGRTVLSARMLDTENGQVVWEDQLNSDSGEAGFLPVRAANSMLKGLKLPVDQTAGMASVSEEDYHTYLTALGLIRSREREQMKASIELLRGVTSRNPEFSGGWSALAKALFLTGFSGVDPAAMAEEARAASTRALEIDPESVEALKARGMIALTSEERFGHLEKATQLDPGDAEAWLWFSHFAAHPDYPGLEAQAMRELVSIDPLWSRTWQASLVVAQYDTIDAAMAIEKKIERAAIEPYHRDGSLARQALLRKDISEFYRLDRQAVAGMSPSERQVSHEMLGHALMLVELPALRARPPGAAGLLYDVTVGKLPPMEELERYGLAGDNFWTVPALTICGPSLFARDGREEELLAMYDASFGSPENMVAFAERHLRPQHFIANTSTYVALAMQRAGREEEAEAMFALAEQSVARWTASSGSVGLLPAMFRANLAAAKGERDRAVAAVKDMIGISWPYTQQSRGVALIGPLFDDPAWEKLRDDPEIVELLAPIRANLERERREIIALGASEAA